MKPSVEEHTTVVTKRHTGLVLGVLTIVTALDQVTKYWALEALADDHTIDLVGTLRFRLVFNTGAAFGKFSNSGSFLGVIAFALLIWLLSSRRMTQGRASSLAVGCMAGGIVGNLSDRLFRAENGFLNGAVVDFIDVQWWPVWNVADMGIVLGAIALVICLQRRNMLSTGARHESEPKPQED